jgi:hypothetical protein
MYIYVTRMEEMIISFKVLEGKTSRKEIPCKPMRRWRNDIKIDFIQVGVWSFFLRCDESSGSL